MRVIHPGIKEMSELMTEFPAPHTRPLGVTYFGAGDFLLNLRTLLLMNTMMSTIMWPDRRASNKKTENEFWEGEAPAELFLCESRIKTAQPELRPEIPLLDSLSDALTDTKGQLSTERTVIDGAGR